MASMFFFVWIIIILTFAAVILGSTKTKNPVSRLKRTIADDGHVIPFENDITCETAYGHNHAATGERRYIVHEDPPEGYVVLNGIKRRIEDCKYL